MNAVRLQRDLKALGLYLGAIDGIWGPLSETAYLDMVALASTSGAGDILEVEDLAWGSKVDAGFRTRIVQICGELGIEPDWLMTCIAFETAQTFRPDVRNMAGSGATGLIQFMPSTARSLGTTTEALASMSAIRQLDYVRAYFQPYQGRMKSLADVYMAILWPRAVGEPLDYVLWDRAERPTTYRQNSGLDTNEDGVVTKSEAAARLEDLLLTGRRFYLN